MLKKLPLCNILNFFSEHKKNFDTIYALATGVTSAISIVRVGGRTAFRALQLLQRNTEKVYEGKRDHGGQGDQRKNFQSMIFRQYLNKYKLHPRQAHFRNIYNTQGNMIDQCLILCFPPQHSYNSEQIIQFHVHGSKAIVSSIFKQLNSKGFRMAQRGQFTRRAVLNGKINLVQAQAINDLIKSQTQFERQISINNLLGKTQQFLQQVKNQLIKCLANNQAYIDFQQDEENVKDDLFIKNKIVVKQNIGRIQKIIQNYQNLQILKTGINVTIIGKPNVGKSTLLNALAKKQVAIVSSQPGTTRDVLQTSIQCSGVLVRLFDTAGLRETNNAIENQGMKRAKMKIKESQINLLIIDIDQEQIKQHMTQNGDKQIQIINSNETNDSITTTQINYNSLLNKNTITIINKCDKLPENIRKNTKFFMYVTKTRQNTYPANHEKTDQEKQTIPQINKIYIDLVLSAESMHDIDKLTSYLSQKISTEYSLYKSNEQIYFTRERYFTKLQQCSQYLQKYMQEERPDIACQYLRLAVQEVSEIFGKVDVEDVLDVLFREFCIGK